ncbi:Por secretion system C-terminal sorting domain-containing protein [Polaribacter sp. Hel1_33_78]|uniref:T9SS type A sorting domain-containing protein n=1 Tax=Polaribacter sp. Hel1_33_78 TaxID=1336804 RepID=UPI00087CB005|nr:T9SS type A sorting domain-containing protein [Polaribacter sp. Hel1_33_78]SDT96658.1 Por secretion system C-terminal sorting domain-containing protein [Polaribacter sp. Hel1_33_78]
MIQRKIILLFAIVFITIANAQSISFTSATLTKGLVGNTIQVDYEYTVGSAGYIYCSIENQQQNWTAISTVASAELNPAPAGTSVTGSFSLVIPTSTVPFYNLPNGSDGVQTVYRIKITLSDSSFNYLDGKFPGDWIQLTNFANFTETTNSDWATASNWDVDVPNATTNVTIPAGKTAVISSSTGANTNDLTVNASGSLAVNSGGSLQVAGTSTGNMTYNVNVADTNWHFVASPFVGAQYDNTWVTNNEIASGSVSASNKGISTYDNAVPDATTGHWSYYQGGTTETFGTGIGYGFKKDASASGFNYGFTGTMPTTVNSAITQDDNNWNLIGNSYPSYMDITAFIASNGMSGTDQLSDTFQSVYVWNATNSLYEMHTSGYLQPGQAFFVNSKVSSGTVAITTAMQSHQTSIPFYKTSTTTLNLSVSNGSSTKKTQINYFNDKTNGLDPGFDIGMFNGVVSDLNIYTHLVENNEGIALGRQALAISEMKSQIIPIGLQAEAGKEITFSIEALNLPSGIQVSLEDRDANTFASLTDSDVKVTLDEHVYGTGKYYIHLSNSVLSIDNSFLESVSVFASNNANLKVIGLPRKSTSLKLFNLLGKQVFNTTFISIGSDNISLPKLSKGVYIVQIASENRNLNKKIILE